MARPTKNPKSAANVGYEPSRAKGNGHGGNTDAIAKADFILANGSMSFNQSGDGEIRKSLIEAELGTAAPTSVTTENHL